jgi:cellulase/cellobiase CelA1
LNFDNVAMYLDGGHGGWLGWPANIGPAADLFASIYTAAGKPKAVRGIATDVSNYNAYQLATAPSYTQSNPSMWRSIMIHGVYMLTVLLQTSMNSATSTLLLLF